MSVPFDMFTEWLQQTYGDSWHAWQHASLEAVKAAYMAGYADAHTEMRQQHGDEH